MQQAKEGACRVVKGNSAHPWLLTHQTSAFHAGGKTSGASKDDSKDSAKSWDTAGNQKGGWKSKSGVKEEQVAKPCPNTLNFRLPPLRWHCLSQLPLWVVLPELPALVPEEGRVRNKCMQLSHSHCLMSWALPRKRFNGPGSSSCTTFLRADHNAECASDGPLNRRSST